MPTSVPDRWDIRATISRWRSPLAKVSRLRTEHDRQRSARLRDLLPHSGHHSSSRDLGSHHRICIGGAFDRRPVNGFERGAASHAVALSVTHGNTLAVVRTGQLANSKASANAMVASQSVLCSLFAAEGMTGALGAIEHPRGLSTGMLAGAKLDLLAQPLGERYRIMTSAIKAYPVSARPRPWSPACCKRAPASPIRRARSSASKWRWPISRSLALKRRTNNGAIPPAAKARIIVFDHILRQRLFPTAKFPKRNLPRGAGCNPK